MSKPLPLRFGPQTTIGIKPTLLVVVAGIFFREVLEVFRPFTHTTPMITTITTDREWPV
ncbi:hypothetical protein [Malikia spinosa]|uniref:hypothetical protein n=1 Tax=Malikia spinosa TaxID=86180 RepID=UPI003FA3213E